YRSNGYIMEGFSDRLEELYRSFSILESREDREKAVVDLSVALQKMSATLDSPSDVLAEEATRIIAAEYGQWDAPSTSFDPSMIDSSPYDAAQEMYEYSDNLREDEDGEGVEGGTMTLLNYWKDNNYEDSAVPSTSRGWTEEDRRKRLIDRKEEVKDGASEDKRLRLDRLFLSDEGIEGEVDLIGCVICGIDVDSFDAYLSHMQSTHVERDENDDDKVGEEKKKEWKCAECNFVASCRKTLWRHGRSSDHEWSKKEKEIEYSCEMCDYSTSSKFNLDRHRMRNHSEPQEIECPLCFSVLPSLYSFLTHHDSIHREKNYRFQCELCRKEFTRKDKLIRHHKVVHEAVRPFPCPSCSSSFPSAWHLRRHLKSERGCKDPLM
ncbi:hypothetical protein PRIPAC_75243, partial [Pristionchus pacificus]|uniref:C2H2-type domain-containing protein n=1 Tax=Pristionchus pacificus TaxID=54126 RepID=A0A8R1V2I7_PRIPA